MANSPKASKVIEDLLKAFYRVYTEDSVVREYGIYPWTLTEQSGLHFDDAGDALAAVDRMRERGWIRARSARHIGRVRSFDMVQLTESGIDRAEELQRRWPFKRGKAADTTIQERRPASRMAGISNGTPRFVVETRTREIYVDSDRVDALRRIKSERFDMTKLIALCEELNKSYSAGNYFSTAMLVRALLDHVPPIFACRNFTEVANNYKGARSFKDAMANLDGFARKIADSHLHEQIRAKEILPSKTQVDFRPGLDVLLTEVIRVLG